MKNIWLTLRRFIRRPFKFMNPYLPKGLYVRSLVIIVAPMIILQTIMTLVFMERHWQSVTQDLSSGVARSLSSLVEVIEIYPEDLDFPTIRTLAGKHAFFNIALFTQRGFTPPLTHALFLATR